MTPFTRHEGKAVILPLDNVDTDQIIPARFLRKPRSAGYGNFLLHDLRFDEAGSPVAGFPLNEAGDDVRFIVAGSNFGCGSSREGAVYALVDYGIRAVIAPRVADIFRNNAVRNGLLPVELDAEAHATLTAAIASAPDAPLSIDLESKHISHPNFQISFEIDEPSRRRLLLGLDDIAETAERFAVIDAFETTYRLAEPWRWPAAQ
ncbi:3-isopropylmalate dehydratase small subunit [Microvirga sp. GCM10011540]|uniref:3-isopropylmalate dehydratase small subunit n=1 Tax=Microvirga sp. GCM10011540 TaxID=3317338 RepID=UPI00360C1A61